MRIIAFIPMLVTFALAGCASQATLSSHEIERLHTVKVVYIQASHELGMRSFVSNNVMPVPLPGGTLFVPGSIYDRGDVSAKYLGPYQGVISTFDAREQLFTAATQALAQIPWLQKTPIEVADHPMSNDDEWHYTKDAGVDAVIFLTPTVALDDMGYNVHVQMQVDVFVNPHTKSPYEYDSALFGDRRELQLKQNPNEPHHSLSALSADKAVAVWFADGATQLHADIDAMLPPIGPDLAHYLAGDAPTKGN